jgi:hypothetical protein
VPGEISFRIKARKNTEINSVEPRLAGGYDQSSLPSHRSREHTFLSVGSVKEASSGNGMFHTLVPVQPGKTGNESLLGRESTAGPAERAIEYFMNLGSPTVRMPTSPESRLRARFIHLVGEKPISFNPTFLWGSWVKLVPERIGRSAALNDATASFIAANVARHDMTEHNIAAARAKYCKSLQSLRCALSGPHEQRVCSETLAAVKMMAAFEVRTPPLEYCIQVITYHAAFAWDA